MWRPSLGCFRIMVIAYCMTDDRGSKAIHDDACSKLLHGACCCLGFVVGLSLCDTPTRPLHSCKPQKQLHAVHSLTGLLQQSGLCRQPEGTPVNSLKACAGRKSVTDDDSEEWEEDGASDEEANGAIAKLEAQLGVPGGLGLGQGGCNMFWHGLLFSQILGIPEIGL